MAATAAYYNRCLAEALVEMPEVREVILLARVMCFAPEEIPPKVKFIRKSTGGKTRRLCAMLILVKERFGLVSRYGLKGRKVIMTLARLPGFERYKGIDEVLEAIPRLLEYVPNLIYMVLGEGDDKPRLEAKALGIGDRGIFTGLISESDKADYLRLADVFALPGRKEGFGIVYLEDMACGIPVVGSKLDGSREALRDGLFGELVDPVDQGILNALVKPKGIPPGLSYFAWPAFVDRIAVATRTQIHGRPRE